VDWINVILQGILVGGLYAMFAAGLSLIFGVMRLVNIAHGDLIVLAAYVALVTTQTLGIGPLTALIVVVPVMALIGYALQWFVLNRTLGDDLLPPLLVTFGLSVIIQNGLLTLFTADSVKLQAGDIEVATIRLTDGIYVGVLPLLQSIGDNVAMITAITEELTKLEGRVDDLHDIGLRELFLKHRNANTMDFIIGAEIYDHLEKVADRFDDVANEISSIMIEMV